MEMNFGFFGGKSGAKAATTGSPFRVALLGDFSGRANRGELASGTALSDRKPIRIDVDNIEKIFAKLNISLQLPLGEDGAGIEIPLKSLDDFHPDQLYENVELFSALSDLRLRLNSKNQFAAAARELQGWLGDDLAPLPKAGTRARATNLPKGGKLSDFAALIGKPRSADAGDASVDDLVQRLVAPFVKAAKDPRQDEMLAALDQSLSDAMRRVLHHPDFQTLEALWRSVDLMTRRIETAQRLQLVLYDISAEEFAADLSAHESLEETALYQLLIEQPALDANQGALSVLLGFYNFDLTPPQAELLGRAAKIGAAAYAPFIAQISNDALISDPDEIHPLVKQAWAGLRALPEASYLGLALPRFLLRQPYGENTDPIDSFDFEEFTPRSGLGGMLWANPVTLIGILLAQTYQQQGWKMNLGSVLSMDDMPYYFYRDADDDVTALPCTERLMPEKAAAWLRSQHFMPVVSIKGRPEVRLGGFISMFGDTLIGPWAEPKKFAPPPPPAAKPAPAAAPVAAAPVAEAAPAVSDDDLQDLLKSLDTPEPAAEPEPAPEPVAEAAAAEPEGDAELDALLKMLDEPAEPPPAAAGGEEEMDPDLADLLKGL
ncbi:MAG TPA: type VI secretion system contractile sheath large subunit [Aliidongia sp.]|nr:type VI secretion system contractile sheath large subunit [Aliidongia sp.]